MKKPATYQFINKINFGNLDKFVQMLVAGYVSRRGQSVVKREIGADSTSDTSNFLTHIIEVGSLKVLTDNDMIGSDRNKNERALITVGLAMNISMASALKSKNVYDLDTPVYYDMPSLKIIFDRIASHVGKTWQDSAYTKSLVSNYLMNKI